MWRLLSVSILKKIHFCRVKIPGTRVLRLLPGLEERKILALFTIEWLLVCADYWFRNFLNENSVEEPQADVEDVIISQIKQL